MQILDRFTRRPEPIVKLPTVSDEQREAIAQERDVLRRNRIGLLSAIYLRSPAPYEKGTVPAHVKRHRRAKGKVAKQSRKINRGR